MSNPFRDPSNPYAAPESSLAPDMSVAGISGGSLEATLAGQTQWTIGEVLNDAWQLTNGFKGTFWLTALAMMGVGAAQGVVGAVATRLTGTPLGEMVVSFAFNVALVWPLQVGLVMLGVRRAAGAETKASMMGAYMDQIPRITGLMILQFLLVALGLVLLVIPGIYLAVSYVLAIPLMLDRRMGIWEALETSRKVIGTCWFKTFGLLLTFIPITLLVIVTLGIGIIWIAPMLMLIIGVLYQRLVGYAGGEAA
jgi:hypothetical protein